MEAWRFSNPCPEAFAHFGELGFVVIDQVLSEQELARIDGPLRQMSEANQAHKRHGRAHAIRNLLQSVPAIDKLARSPAIRSLVEPVLGREAFPVKGILFDKHATANWKVAWHQDPTICVRKRIETPGFGPWSVKDGVLNVQPPELVLSSLMTVRIHLDDCGTDNGPLRVIPRSHVHGRLNASQIREFRQRVQEVSCTVRLGGVLLLRPLTLHASSPAKKPAQRRVVHVEFSASKLPGGLAWAA